MPQGPRPPSSRPRPSTSLSTGAVARACGVTSDSVVRWIRAGHLRAFQTPGGHFRVLRADLDLLLRGSGRPEPGPGPAPRILVVEDDDGVRDLLADLLRGEGFEVSTATTTDEARRAASVVLPDLLITDVVLPGGDGPGLTRDLRARPGGAVLPIIAMTGAFEDDRLAVVYAAGADVCLAKPFQPNQLLGEVRRLLGRRGPGAAGA